MLENEWKQDINILNDTKDENIQKEILEVENLDNLIHIMNDKIKVKFLYKMKKQLFLFL